MHGLGAKLREVREKRGMTQRELAARIHKSTPAISAYETDAQTPPTDVLISISQVLACGDSYPLCPRCGGLTDREYMAFCDQCGQCLGWKFYAFAQTVRYGAGDQKTAKFPVSCRIFPVSR